jgi:hypothetical protein
MTAYIKHTASVLDGDEYVESIQLPIEIAENASSAMAYVNATTNSIASHINSATANKNKRKREKKEKDPNAPKRPLTAMFLFAQAARPVVKKDLEAELGPNAKLEPNAVQLEVTKRWNDMSEEEKDVSRSPCCLFVFPNPQDC